MGEGVEVAVLARSRGQEKAGKEGKGEDRLGLYI